MVDVHRKTDFNADGIPDFVLGNFGTNNKYHPSTEKPLKVYSSDFDGNSTNDIVLAKNYKGKYVPVRGRECSSEQMPFVAEKFSTFSEFANASIENILEEEIDKALELEVQEFRSGMLIQKVQRIDLFPFLHRHSLHQLCLLLLMILIKTECRIYSSLETSSMQK